jgi:microcystin-dependent protein
MKWNCSKSMLSLTLAASLFTGAVCSTDSQACSSDPYISGVCIMAAVRSSSFGNTYVLANGATLPVTQYQALYALIGNTYGGSGTTTFQLPDLRGRVVVGAGQGTGLPNYNPGAKGGAVSVTLSSGQLPLHAHALATGAGGVTVASTAGSLAAVTTMTGLTATTTLGTLSANTTLSGLTATLKAAGSGTGIGDATNAALLSGQRTTTFSTTAPAVNMNSGCIVVAGNAATTLTGTPVTTISGNPTTTLSGAPLVTIAGQTGPTGSGAPVSTLPPYLALNYYIAMNGLFPSYD